MADEPGRNASRRVVLAGLGAALLVGVGTWAFPASPAMEATALCVALGVAIAVLVIGVRAARQHQGRMRLGWVLLAAFPTLSLAFLALRIWVGNEPKDLNSWPLEATGGAVELAFGAGLSLILPPRLGWTRLARLMLDAAITGGSILFLLWTMLEIGSAESISTLSLSETQDATFDPAAGIVLVTVAWLVYLNLRHDSPAWFTLLAWAALALFFTATAASLGRLLAWASPGTWTTVGAIASGVLVLGAAMESARWPATLRLGRTFAEQWLVYVLFGMAMLSAGFDYWEHAGISPPLFLLAMLVVAAIVARTILLILENRRLLQHVEAQDAYKGELLRFLSHEMANPISPLRIQTTLQRAASADPDGKGWRVMDRSLARLEALSTDVRLLALAETGRIVGQMDMADVCQQVRAAVESARVSATSKALVMTVEAPESLLVPMDKTRIGQVLDNLLSNAIKYTPAGTITVRVLPTAAGARVDVRDTGPGLTRQQQDALFQAFSRIHRDQPGLGLGLYICKSIVLAHGGRIGVDSAGPGQGSTFWFTLPLARTPST